MSNATITHQPQYHTPTNSTVGGDAAAAAATSTSPVMQAADDNDIWKAQSGILRIYSAYPSVLPRGTCVKLQVAPHTTSQEVLILVLDQLARAAAMHTPPMHTAPTACTPPQIPKYSEEHVDEFSLVAVVGARERVLRPDFRPLQLQNPWTKGRLYVRLKTDVLAALDQGHVTSV